MDDETGVCIANRQRSRLVPAPPLSHPRATEAKRRETRGSMPEPYRITNGQNQMPMVFPLSGTRRCRDQPPNGYGPRRPVRGARRWPSVHETEHACGREGDGTIERRMGGQSRSWPRLHAGPGAGRRVKPAQAILSPSSQSTKSVGIVDCEVRADRDISFRRARHAEEIVPTPVHARPSYTEREGRAPHRRCGFRKTGSAGNRPIP